MEHLNDSIFNIWVTNDCNLKCTYCYEGIDKSSRMMTSEILNATMGFIERQIVDNHLSKCWIVFHGGEPMLNFPIIREFVERANDTFDVTEILYGITTNGTLINKDNYLFLLEHFQDITVSIDGYLSIHDKNRRGLRNGSFRKALASALLLAEKRNSLRIRMTVTAETVNYLFESVKFLVLCGFNTIIPSIDYGDKKWNDDRLSELKRELLHIQSWVKDYGENVFVAMTDPIELQEVGVCQGGINSFHIDADGSLYPCAYTVGNNEYLCGNVFEGINNKRIDEFCSINKKKVQECVGCSFYNGCFSTRCKFINKSLTGDFFTPSALVCNVQRIKVSLFRQMMDGEI